MKFFTCLLALSILALVSGQLIVNDPLTESAQLAKIDQLARNDQLAKNVQLVGRGPLAPRQKNPACKTIALNCPCGKGKDTLSFKIQQCMVKNGTSNEKTCSPCNKSFLFIDLCKRFKRCRTCANGVPKCITCSPGRRGATCSKKRARRHKLKRVRKSPFPVHITIPLASRKDDFVLPRYIRASDSCQLPDPQKTNEVDCVMYPSSVKCTQKCVYGYTYPEGQSRETRCRHQDNEWDPHGFDECKPFAHCDDVVLTEPGDIYCVSHQIKRPSYCEVKCYSYEDEAHLAREKHKCHLDSTWEPPLPSCVKPNEDEELVSPPEQIEDEDEGGRHHGRWK